MFGKKKQRILEPSPYPTNKENEVAIMRLFDFGFIGKPEYYSNGDISIYQEWKIWKPIDENTRLYLHGITALLPISYRFWIGKKSENGWSIPHSDYIFVDSLENLNDKLTDSLNKIIQNHSEVVKYFSDFKQLINEIHSPKGVEQE